MAKIKLQYKFNRFLTYYFLDFSLGERVRLWINLLVHEVLRIKTFRNEHLRTIATHQVYVISLMYRNDRRSNIKFLLGRKKIDFEFFDGVSPHSVIEFKDFFTNYSFGNLTEGSKGCAVSHILLWRQISEDPNNSLNFIFEDDIILHDDFSISKILEELPYDFDVIYLGNWNSRGRDINYSIAENVARSYNPRKGLYAYAITPKGAKKLLQQCLPINIIYGGLDTKLGKVIRQGKAKAYQRIPNLVSVDSTFPSDIFNPSSPKKNLYNNILK